jgi:hypothetical protein
VSGKQRTPAGRQLAAAPAGDGKRELELRRRRSRVPWIYAVYHARERRLDGSAGTGRFERVGPDPFEPP